MSKNPTIRQVIGFRHFFPGQQHADKLIYANRIGKETLQTMVCHFLSYFRLERIPEPDQLLKEWFTLPGRSHEKSISYSFFADRYRRMIDKYPQYRFGLLNVESLLRLFTWTRSVEITEPEEPSAGVMTDMLYLYLIFNDELLDDLNRAAASAKSADPDRETHRLMLSTMFPQNDLVNPDYAQLIFTQFYKAMMTLEFLEMNGDCSAIYQAFLNYYHCATKEEYMQRLAPAALQFLLANDTGWSIMQVPLNDEFLINCAFFDRLALQPEDSNAYDQNDYLAIRSSPYQKLSIGEYRIIYDLFVIKKVYNGMVFKLFELVRLQRSLFKEDFPGFYRRAFSESTLLYSLLSGIMADAVHITGDRFQKEELPREPDYYIRDEHTVLLFESKDFYMRGDIKLSYDFDQIMTGLNKDRLGKAVEQLATNAERVLTGSLPLDKAPEPDKVMIFPIIIVHDALYSAPGLNYWIDTWMKNAVNRTIVVGGPGGLRLQVAPVTVLEVDTFILYHIHFISGKFNLIQLINDYQVERQFRAKPDEAHSIQSAYSFSEFIRDHGHSINLDIDMSIVTQKLKTFGIKDSGDF